jgi:hypothetical protein
MILRSIQGDDNINALVDATLIATLNALKNEEYLTDEVAREFFSSHTAVFAPKDSLWERARKFLGIDHEKDSVIVVKVVNSK